MMRKWKSSSLREKIALVVNSLLFVGILLLSFLYLAGKIRYPLAAITVWVLFGLHFFMDAFGKWNVDRDRAVHSLFYGGFVSVFAIIGLLSWLI